MDRQDARRSQFLRTALVFVGLNLVFHVALRLLGATPALGSVTRLTAVVAGFLSQLVGSHVTVIGSDMFVGSRVLTVNLDCTAAYVMAVFTAMLLAFPATVRMKLSGLAVGLSAIVLANYVRLVLIVLIAEKAPRYFEPVHDYLFQVALLLVAAILWLVWMSKVETDAA